MVEDKYLSMSSYRGKLSKKTPGFDRKNFSAILIIAFGMVLMGGYGASQVASGYDVSIGQNGIEMGTGTLDVMGNDIESSGTTIWDASTGEIPDAVLGIELSTNAGNDLTWDATNNEFDVDSNNIQSGTTASDVGLGNVENEAQVAESGDTMTGELLMSENIDFDVGERIQWDDGNRASITEQTSDLFIQANGVAYLQSDSDGSSGGPYQCYVSDSNGDFACGGSKSWIHDLGNGSEAFYTSQESPEVRAVFEGQTTVENGMVNVSLPNHFSKTVSDAEPMLRVQTTPHELATVAATERTDDYLVIQSTEDVKVDFRITGIREGYEAKQVVRPKEE